MGDGRFDMGRRLEIGDWRLNFILLRRGHCFQSFDDFLMALSDALILKC